MYLNQTNRHLQLLQQQLQRQRPWLQCVVASSCASQTRTTDDGDVFLHDDDVILHGDDDVILRGDDDVILQAHGGGDDLQKIANQCKETGNGFFHAVHPLHQCYIMIPT